MNDDCWVIIPLFKCVQRCPHKVYLELYNYTTHIWATNKIFFITTIFLQHFIHSSNFFPFTTINAFLCRSIWTTSRKYQQHWKYSNQKLNTNNCLFFNRLQMSKSCTFYKYTCVAYSTPKRKQNCDLNLSRANLWKCLISLCLESFGWLTGSWCV